MRNTCLAVCTIALFAGILTGLRWLATASRIDSTEEARPSEGWEDQRQYFLWSHVHRHEIIERLIAGEISLPEAAARFAAVESQRPLSLPNSYNAYVGSTTEEKICRQVIYYVEGILKTDPRREAVMQRLEAQLAAFLDPGPPRLPTFPPDSGFRHRITTN